MLLLIASGEEATTMRVKLKNPDSEFINEHRVTLVKSPNFDRLYYLEPTWYNGTSSFNTKLLSDDMLYGTKVEELSTFESNLENIIQARKRVYEYLIKKYKIKELSHSLDLNGLSDLEKHARIITYMSKHLVDISEPVRARSVLLEGKEIEIGKALELFYYANDIKFSPIVKKNNSRIDTLLNIWIDGKFAVIIPKKLFKLNENDNSVSKKGIAVRQPDESFQTIDKLNEYDPDIIEKQMVVINNIESKSKD